METAVLCPNETSTHKVFLATVLLIFTLIFVLKLTCVFLKGKTSFLCVHKENISTWSPGPTSQKDNTKIIIVSVTVQNHDTNDLEFYSSNAT